MAMRQVLTTMRKLYVERKEAFIVKKDLFEEAVLAIELFDVSDVITASNALDDEEPLSLDDGM